MARLSGLQKDALSLYRKSLRAIRSKPKDSQPRFQAFARAQFEKHLNVDPKDFTTIEFLIRKGQRQVENYSMPGITDISRF